MQGGGVSGYKLEELARAAGTSARTVRYYVQRGLLPAPEFRGKDTAYGREHLVRLRAIRKMQEAYLPLDEIAGVLGSRSIGDIERIAEGAALKVRPKAGGSGGERVCRRIKLAEGVELMIDEEAPGASKRLVEEILAMVSSAREGR
ncbi:MAG: MerR family transcriptional regulator [Labilithrix sp.]|nr:MerR family transcriptional regulator [Labilithrix sp.]